MPEAEAATNSRERLMRALPFLLLLATLVAMIAPALDPQVQLFYRDTGRLHYPVKKFIAAQLQGRHLPLWDPWTESGTSLLGQVTPGLLHPFTLLYLALPFDLAFKLNHLVVLPLAGLGTYLLSRRLGCSRWAAAAGGVGYGGCGYLASMAAGNLTYALGASTVPLALATFLAYDDAPSAGRLLMSAATLALAAYAGDPQSMLIAGVIGTALAATRAVASLPGQAPLRSRLLRGSAAGLRAAAWGALALALSAPVALPAAARLPEIRGGGVTEQERRAFLVTPRRLLGYLVPEAFDDQAASGQHGSTPGQLNPFPEFFAYETDTAFSDSILVGAPVLLLALMGCLAGRKGRFLFAGALLFTLASAGQTLGIQELLMAGVPGFRYFRYAEKFAAPASLLFALAAGFGLDFSLGGAARAGRALALAAAVLAAFAALAGLLLARDPAAAASLAAQLGKTHSPALAAQLIASLRTGLLTVAALATALAGAAVLREGRMGGFASALALGCCSVAALACNTGTLLTAPVELMRGPFGLADLLTRRAGASPGRWRLYTFAAGHAPGNGVLGERLGEQEATAQALAPQFDTLAGVEGASAYFSALDLRYLQAIETVPSRIGLVLGIRFFLAMPDNFDALSGPQHGFTRLPRGYWLLTLPERPRAFAVAAARPVPPNQMIAELRAARFSPTREALVDAQDAPALAGLPPHAAEIPAKTRWSRPSAERIEIAVETPAKSLLVVAEHFDAGWRATVDGAPAPAVRVDAVAIGVPVPAGRHEVELTFHPIGFAPGMWVLGAALACLAGWVLVRRTRVVSR